MTATSRTRRGLLAFVLVFVMLVPIGGLPVAASEAAAPVTCSVPVFVNEFHYDNDGTDVNEFIEVAGPASADLTGWTIVLYNGNGGTPYLTINLGGAIPDQGSSGYGTLFFAAPGMQNGAPDGFALVDAGNVVQQFLSYEGTFVAVGGPADGMTSVDVGVSQPSTTPIGESLQLIGTGECPEDFTWTGPVDDSPGDINAGQTFVPATPTARMALNEFVPKGAEWVELYNGGTADQDVTGWYVTDTVCGSPASAIGAVTVNPGGFFVVSTGDPGANFSLDNNGDVVILCDAGDTEVDRVAYGSVGGAPLAPFASNGPQYSAARVADGQDSDNDAVDWNLDPTPTQGTANDVAGTALGSSLIVNEMDIFPATGNDFVELYNPTSSDVDVSGWLLSDGDDVAILNAGLSVPAGGWLALEETVDWTTEGTTGVDFGGTDVAYLFDNNRIRVDQLGWTSGPFINGCIARVPDGAGPNVGFDWLSSGGDVTLFDQPCTMGSANYTPPGSNWVINEIHADPDAINGDANGDGVVDTSQDEFVELVNNSGVPVDISGWILSDEFGVRHTFPADTVIPDQCAVVVFGGGTPAGDFGFATVQTASTGALGLNNTGDTVTLNNGSTDVVSYNYGAEGGNNQSLTRDPDITGPDPLVEHSTATGSGGALFSPGTQIDGTPFVGCLSVCGLPSTPIHDIQGSGLASPLVGQQHTVEALVIADFQGVGNINGYYVQEPDVDQDADPATSEGLFVWDPGVLVDVAVGDYVRVTGFVSEFQQQTQLSSLSAVTICPANPSAATPVTVTLPFSDTVYPERFEGMTVVMTQTLTVSENFNLGRGGIVTLSNGRLLQPTNVVLPGAPANALQAANNLNQIIMDDGNLAQNPDPIIYPPPELTALNTLRSGDQVSDIAAVFSEGGSGWSNTTAYRIHPFSVPTFTFDNPRPPAPDPVRAGGSLKVSSFNVLNYFLTLDDGVNDICGPDQNMECRGADSAVEFTRQRDKLLQALYTLNADVVGLMELENTPGVEPLQDIVDGLNALAGAGTYDYIDAGTIVPGDVIKVGLIYKPGVVQPVGNFAILNSLVDPNFDTDLHRPALAQTFQEIAINGRFTVIVNHLKSKGSCPSDPSDPNADQGDGQACWNQARVDAANALVNWALSDPTGTGDPDFLIMGDLNSYAKEDPIAALETAGYTNLETLFVGPDAYSYVFFAQAGSLDHSMSNASLTPQVSGATTWHINADEPSVLDYNVEFKSPNHVTLLYNADPFRTSDHDPVLVGLNLLPVDASILVTKTVGTDAGVCATTNDISVPAGTDVYYCYAVANTGNLTLNLHDLDDSELGSLFAMLPYTLTPGSSVNTVAAGLEISATIDATTVNTALWTAYNAGPIDVITATATATVTILPPNIFVDPLALSSTQLPNVQTQQTLTISNTGGSDLDWEILEEPVSMAAPAPASQPPLARIDSQAAMAAEMEGLESAGPTVLPQRDPSAAARSQRTLLANGLLLVPDSTNDRIMAFDPVTGNLVDADFVPADPANLSTPKNAILSAGGNSILVSDQIDDVVQEYALDGSYIGVFAPAGGANTAILDNITGIDLRPNGNLLVSVQSGANADSVAEFDTSGNYLGNFIANGSGGLDGPFDVYPRTADWLVSGITNDEILRYDLVGAFIASLAPINNFPQQVTEAATGNVLVANFGGTQEGVVELTPAGAVVGVYDPTVLGGYRGAYELPNGNILTTNGSGVHEIDRSGALVQTKISGVSAQYIEYVVPQTACTNPADIPWASTDPISGTTPAGNGTDVQVTLDSTGLQPGTYTGNLCITSNDPDAGPGNETDLVVVPLTLVVESPTAVTLSDLSAAQAPLPLAGLPLAALPAAVGLALGAAYVLRRQR